MKHLLRVAAILLASHVTAAGSSPPDDLKVTSDGGVLVKTTLGEMAWRGHVEVEHRRFHLTTQGSVSIFGGPAIRKKSPAGTRLNRKDLSLEHQWISLVAIGDITVRVIDPDGASRPIRAQRFVYLPRKDQFLIDGKPWKPSNAAQQP